MPTSQSREPERNKPWDASYRGERPDEPVLRAMARHLFDWQIAAMFEVSRQTVGYWRGEASPPIPPRSGSRPPRLSHKELLPWTLAPEHAHDSWARGLRALSRQRQGVEVNRTERSYLERVERALASGKVIAYDHERGFFVVEFDAALDAPGAVVRGPG